MIHRRMDLTIPYTFYPQVLPHWLSWTLFGFVLAGGTAAGVGRGLARGWRSGLKFGLLIAACILALTMVLSGVLAFFYHNA